MNLNVSNYELWVCVILFLAASSFYFLYYLRSKVKYTNTQNEAKKKNQIVAIKTIGFMLIGVTAIFIFLLFTL